ncbi:hypothetical protein AWC19_14590 [Mycobacterium palustre]|uniref:Amidohydrolase-related domain-containing protein n=1 Tax=Mycobacterium palustre TaxID=153971 RepID=A0A1X1ZCA3_9MYCO|nr:hypothetical protein AWC19_14590 [Mycobacterium palustre]
MTEISTAIPDFPMTRAPGCPFAPPPKVLSLNADSQLSRVRIWDGSTPWLIHGYDAIRALFADSRASVDDRLPGYPHWNEGMLMVDGLNLGQIDDIGIDKVMWSSDYPHNESTFGYSERSLAAVVDAVGPEDAVRVVGGNVKRFLGI